VVVWQIGWSGTVHGYGLRGRGDNGVEAGVGESVGRGGWVECTRVGGGGVRRGEVGAGGRVEEGGGGGGVRIEGMERNCQQLLECRRE